MSRLSAPTLGWVTVLWWAVALLAVLGLWSWAEVQGDLLQQEVSTWRKLDFLESRWTYFYLHLFTLLPVFSLSFDRKVHFYRKWKYLFPAILLVGAVFILWDEYFTRQSVWGFNPDYLSGWYALHLPVEEWLFFFTVPYASIFTYECLRVYFPKDPLIRAEPAISYLLLLLFLGVGLWHLDHLYTATTFLLCAAFQGFHLLFLPAGWRSRFYLSYLVILLPFLLVNGVLTGGFTETPVVQYNPGEYLGIRIGSIPVDDTAYGFLLLFSGTTLFEVFRK